MVFFGATFFAAAFFAVFLGAAFFAAAFFAAAFTQNSPYLLQHSNNPIDWFPWCQEAFLKARLENKQIFLSIGYAACHWCHVMAHESFENHQTAEMLNQHLISIKVDREERPDIDSIYMSAVVSMTGHGGRPLSVFLTPEKKPFFGGTYFPPIRRYNMPAFQEVLLSIMRVWREDRASLEKSSEDIYQFISNQQNHPPVSENLPIEDTIEQASNKLCQAYDWHHGGWGKAPKFPQPMALDFLLLMANKGNPLALEVSTHCLDSMAAGGMHDLVAGGFCRYSTDDQWLVPHFEKMLYDNALLARTYLHAFLLTGHTRFRQVTETTLDFLVAHLQFRFKEEDNRISGGFYSSLDADSEGFS